MMHRGVHGHPLGDVDRGRNWRIGLKRRRIERTFAVLKWVFHSGRVVVTTLLRARVKMVFICFCFDLLQMCTIGCCLVALAMGLRLEAGSGALKGCFRRRLRIFKGLFGGFLCDFFIFLWFLAYFSCEAGAVHRSQHRKSSYCKSS